MPTIHLLRFDDVYLTAMCETRGGSAVPGYRSKWFCSFGVN